MSVPVWKLRGWWGSAPAAPSQRSLSSWTLLPAGPESSGWHPGIASARTSVDEEPREDHWRLTVDVCYRTQEHNFPFSTWRAERLTCAAWASLSIFSWMDLDEILCLELGRQNTLMYKCNQLHSIKYKQINKDEKIVKLTFSGKMTLCFHPHFGPASKQRQSTL